MVIVGKAISGHVQGDGLLKWHTAKLLCKKHVIRFGQVMSGVTRFKVSQCMSLHEQNACKQCDKLLLPILNIFYYRLIADEIKCVDFSVFPLTS